MGAGIGLAIRNEQLAAGSILSGAVYSQAPIPCYSFPSLLGFRKRGWSPSKRGQVLDTTIW
jgi:hypothetical protein